MMDHAPAVRRLIEARLLAWPRVVIGSVFGSDGYYVKGHAFAFWEAGGLVLNLPPDAREQALALPGARRYTVPRGSGPGWVHVPADELSTAAELLPLLNAACRYLGGEPL